MLRFIILLISLILIFIPHWIVNVFGLNVTTDQIIYHLFSEGNTLVGTEFSVLKDFFLNCFSRPLSFAMILAMLFYVIYLKIPANLTNNIFIKFIYSKKFDFLILLLSTLYFCQIIHSQYIITNFGKDSLTPIYLNPAKISFENPKNKKNLLLIYVESLEYDLRDPKLQGSNLIQAVDNLPGTNMLVSPAPGTTWTMAGMFSSQCSVPLKVFFADNKIRQTMFYPGVVCLGDILKQQGYTQYFLVGHNVKFAGMLKFYEDHGYDYKYGLKEWQQMGFKTDQFKSWGGGFHDNFLFTQAAKIIEKNIAQKRPYNLTIMTADSHFPEGFPSSTCSEHDIITGFQGAFHCAGEFLAAFINHLESKNLLKNTVVVMMGDHPFMNSQKQLVYFPKPRYVYFKYIDYDTKKKPTREVMTHFDVAPSILDLLEISKSANTEFGIGISMFSNINSNDYADRLEQVTNNNILNRSKTYDSFWVPRSTK